MTTYFCTKNSYLKHDPDNLSTKTSTRGSSLKLPLGGTNILTITRYFLTMFFVFFYNISLNLDVMGEDESGMRT